MKHAYLDLERKALCGWPPALPDHVPNLRTCRMCVLWLRSVRRATGRQMAVVWS